MASAAEIAQELPETLPEDFGDWDGGTSPAIIPDDSGGSEAGPGPSDVPKPSAQPARPEGTVSPAVEGLHSKPSGEATTAECKTDELLFRSFGSDIAVREEQKTATRKWVMAVSALLVTLAVWMFNPGTVSTAKQSVEPRPAATDAPLQTTATKPSPSTPLIQDRVPAGVAVGLLIQKTSPTYPPIAKEARVSGTVELKATISKTGTIEDLRVVSGPVMLQQAALDAVRTWRYKPYSLNNDPTEVQTINVIFSLGG